MPPPLTLKQKLAVLSLSPSSPTPPHGSHNPPKSPMSPRRKNFFSPPWPKRNPHDRIVDVEEESRDKVQQVVGKIIFQAGVDFETRPMIILNASGLPDAREVSYDLLLFRILSYLNLYVESDYTIVFFAAGSKNTPGWNWIWKAYRSLSRKYRKNLQRLYIVHPTFFSKMLFSLAGAIISPKFFRKLTYVNTLSELACQVPITQIDISPAVYQENLKHENKIQLPTPTRSNLFGVPLEEIMGFDGEKGGVPRVVKDSIQFLRETGLEQDGLFRRSPNTVLLNQAKEAYDRGQVVSLETFGDPHLAAVLLKKYLRDLPEPIFPESLYAVIRRCPLPTSEPSDTSSISYIRESILVELAPCVYILLSHVLHLMHDVSLRAASNRMDAHNLAIVLCPNLVSSSSPARDVAMCAVPGGPEMTPTPNSNPATLADGKATLGLVIKLCIQRYYEIFDEVWDRAEAIPHRLEDESISSSGSTNDDEDIDEEMPHAPIGPSQSGAPSAWGASGFPPKPRHRTTNSGGSPALGAQSMHTVRNENGGGGDPSLTIGRSKSMISIERGTRRGKGTISVGRGTTRKSSGAGVEAVGVTAAGFFSSPPTPALLQPGIEADKSEDNLISL